MDDLKSLSVGLMLLDAQQRAVAAVTGIDDPALLRAGALEPDPMKRAMAAMNEFNRSVLKMFGAELLRITNNQTPTSEPQP